MKKERRNKLTEVIRDIYQEKLKQNSPFNIVDMAEAVESLSIDIYSENKRFIYELIQNADDASLSNNSQLLIEIVDDFVIVSHKGKSFDEKDLRGLCGIGRGTKQNDASKTGYKGIGFKSVFGQRDGLVYVKTGDLLFKFDKNEAIEQGWNSKWGSQKDWEQKNQLNFKAPWQLIPLLSDSVDNKKVEDALLNNNYTVKTAIKVESPEKLIADINQLFQDARFILFLRKVSTIVLKTPNGKQKIQKIINSDNSSFLTLKKNNNYLSNWYLKNWIHEVPNEIKTELKLDSKSPKKLQNITKTELSFAIKLTKDGDSVENLIENDSSIFTYLPTNVKEYGFPFLVNSNFLVDAGREKLHKDRIWNKWLFKVIGYQLIECVRELGQDTTLNKSFLKIIVKDYLDETDELGKQFNIGLNIGIDKVAFLKNANGEACLLKDLIRDDTGIISQKLIEPDYLTRFINSATELTVVKNENILPKFTGSDKLENFGLKVFNDFLLKEFVQTKSFNEGLKIILNFELLKFLKSKDDEDATGEWNYIIKNTPFVFSSNGKLEKIPLVCFPVSNFRTGFGSENTIIDDGVYQKIKSDNEIYNWLVKLGVSEPSEIAFLEQEIIGKIDEVVTKDNWKVICEYLMLLHNNNKLSESHYSNLQDLRLKTNSGFKKAKKCFLHTSFLPKIDFNKFFKDLNIVSSDYIGKYDVFEWKSFFVKLNVSDDINFIKSYKIDGKSFDADYQKVAVEDLKKYKHTYPHLLRGNKFVISYFSFFQDTIKYDYAKVFWDRLVEKYSISYSGDKTLNSSYLKENRAVRKYKLNGKKLLLADVMPWGYFNSKENVLSYIEYFLKIKKSKCIPTVLGTNVSVDNAYANTLENIEISGNYLPIIKVNKLLSKDWIQFLGINQELKLDDYLDLITKINLDLFKHKVKTENIKRLGLIYNEISKYLSNLSIVTENKIKNWAKQNQIVCKDRIARSTNDVYWLRVEGFEDSMDKIPALLVPPNVSVNKNIETLFSLMGIKFVDECDYEPINVEEDVNLKIKILEIVPAICLLLKSKLKIDDSNQFLLETYDLLKDFKFHSCSGISLILNYQQKSIKGANVDHYLDKCALFFTTNWRYPIDRYDISKYISKIIQVVGFDQEIQLLLELNSFQRHKYLASQELYDSNINQLSGFIKISELIDNLTPTFIPEKNSDNNLDNNSTENKESIVSQDYYPDEEDSREDDKKENRISYDEEELNQLKGLFGRELDSNELEEENIFAQIKALKHFKNKGFDISQAEVNFKENYKNKYLDYVKDLEGNHIKVLCRSARNGILYFGGYAWVKLEENNTSLFVLRGERSEDCIIINSQEDLENKLKSYYKVIRRSNTNYLDVQKIVDVDDSESELQFLYMVKKSTYDLIFNPQQNTPGISEGGLIDDEI